MSYKLTELLPKDTSEANHPNFLPEEEVEMVKGLAQGHTAVLSQPSVQVHPGLRASDHPQDGLKLGSSRVSVGQCEDELI